MISIETAVYAGMAKSIEQYTLGSIRQLATIYEFDYDEAVGKLSLDKNSTNKPNLGDISDRIEQGDDWCDPTGKNPVNYAKVMAKHNISKETAIELARDLNFDLTYFNFCS